MKYFKSNIWNVSLILAMTFLLGMVSSCKDDDAGDMEAPVIDLEHPMNHGHINNGGEMHFHGTVTDNEQVTDVEISVWENDPNNLLFSVHVHPNTVSYTIDTGFTVTTTDTTKYHFKVYAEDAAGNTVETKEGWHNHINE